MESLPIMDFTIYGALTSVAVTLITEFTKYITRSFNVKIKSEFVVLFLALVVGGVYQAYTQYMPASVQDAIYSFVAGSIGFATMIYTFLIKPIKENMSK